jgi:hypothetical protein
MLRRACGRQAEAATYKAPGTSGERFLDCASDFFAGSEGEKKRRLAPLGMTYACLWRDDRKKSRGGVSGPEAQKIKRLHVAACLRQVG